MINRVTSTPLENLVNDLNTNQNHDYIPHHEYLTNDEESYKKSHMLNNQMINKVNNSNLNKQKEDINQSNLKEINNNLKNNFQNITSLDELDVIFNTEACKRKVEKTINKTSGPIGIKKLSNIDMNIYDDILTRLQSHKYSLNSEKEKVTEIIKEESKESNSNSIIVDSNQKSSSIPSLYQQNSLNLNYNVKDNQMNSMRIKNKPKNKTKLDYSSRFIS